MVMVGGRFSIWISGGGITTGGVSTTTSGMSAGGGGAGGMEHFAEVFDQADVDGALAASVFHSGAIPIPGLKRFLRDRDIEVRDA